MSAASEARDRMAADMAQGLESFYSVWRVMRTVSRYVRLTAGERAELHSALAELIADR